VTHTTGDPCLETRLTPRGDLCLEGTHTLGRPTPQEDLLFGVIHSSRGTSASKGPIPRGNPCLEGTCTLRGPIPRGDLCFEGTHHLRGPIPRGDPIPQGGLCFKGTRTSRRPTTSRGPVL